MVIKACYLSRLPGKPGSHVEISMIYPEENAIPREEILKKTLPFGAAIDDYFDEELNDNNALVYMFQIPNEGFRSDLASICFVYEKPTNKFVLKDVVGELFKFMYENKLVALNVLEENLPKIVNAINDRIKLTIKAGKNKHVFDIPGFIEKRTNEIIKPFKDIW